VSDAPLFDTVLVANRGEIAVRILRTLRELGIRSVAVYSEADRDARHVELADEARPIGPARAAESYLRIDAILDAAAAAGAQAVHPGYGFLAEQPEFAAACEARGLTFIGPTPGNIERAGNKLGARRALAAAGIPVIPGADEPLRDLAAARRACAALGYPVMLKAAAGGGGRGMRALGDEAALVEEFATAQAEARAGFGDPTLYAEKLIVGARHVEVQVLGDGRGGALHLFERNCSLQRRHQKLLEEAPSPGLPASAAAGLHRAALSAVRALRYRNAGTLEFLVDESDRFYFMEMNARIQVEHPVTEAIAGIDLVKAQIHVAATGELPPLAQADIAARGHAIECRINAEDPDNGFLPQPGTIERLRLPGGPGVRVDTHLYQGYTVPLYYDSLLAKIIAHGSTRAEAIATAARALDELACAPLRTTAPFLRRILDHPSFRAGTYTLDLMHELLPEAAEEEEV
jgi:acetyl-CoA carboxylase biotin carboxylase subunit